MAYGEGEVVGKDNKNTYSDGLNNYYTTGGLNSYNKRDSSDEVKRIDILIKALGTMVIVQDIQSDPNNIGQVINKGSIQVPILQDSNRKIAEDKLVQLIKSL